MSDSRTSIYKGYVITTRCFASHFGGYEASFTVFPPPGGESCGQRFNAHAGKTAEGATAHAYRAAVALVEDDRLERTLGETGPIAGIDEPGSS